MNPSPLPVSAPLAFSPNHRRAEAIADELRNLILSGQLPLGQRLPTENMLCQRYAVSRTTLREAIQMLRSTGMLDVTPGRGSFVRAPSWQTLYPQLLLAGQSKGFAPEIIQAQTQRLLTQALEQLPPHWQSQVQGLYQFSVPRNATAEVAAKQEIAWLLGVIQLAENPLLNMLGQWLLGLSQAARVQHYRQLGADAILRTTNWQLRVNAALLEGDLITATRLLAPVVNTPSKPQAA